MSDCIWLSDRMPAVALGRTEWTVDEARHLGECRSCQEEWGLVKTISRLGIAIPIVPDPESTATAVLHRLGREEARARTRFWSLSGLAAAAVAAVVWTGRVQTVPPGGPEGGSVVARVQLPLPELESLQSAELDSVLRTMDDPAAINSLVDDPGLADLDAEELQRVLDTWEG